MKAFGLVAAYLIMALSLTLPQVQELKRRARLDLARLCAEQGDVLNWGRALMPHKFGKPFCQELHGHLVDTRKSPFTSTEAPRGHAKTTIGCVLVPMFQGLVEPKSFIHYLNVQSNADKALTVNRTIKSEMEQNPLIKALYGDQVGGRWTDARFTLRNGVTYSAEGCSASIRGINERGVRPDWMSLDDFYDAEQDTNNPRGTTAKNDLFWGTIYPALAQDRPACAHLRGTAVNREDLFELLKADPAVVSRTFRAVKEWESEEHPDGVLLWPELKTLAEFRKMRERMGTLIFSREFQNERRDDSTSIVKHSWLYPEDGQASWEYDPLEVRFHPSELAFQACVATLDPSIGKKKENDKSGYALVIKAQRGGDLPVYYIEALANAHHSFQERVDQMRQMIAGRHPERPVTKARVETISGFKDIGDKIAAAVSVPCDLVDHVPNKTTNLERHSVLFENKRVFVNKNIDPALKKELAYQLSTNFPKNDDLRDAVLLGFDVEDSSWGAWV